MREVVMAKDVLEHVGLEMPLVSRIFTALGAMGYRVDSLPVSIDQGVRELVSVIDRKESQVPERIREDDHSWHRGNSHRTVEK
jgi:hypothetical protein